MKVYGYESNAENERLMDMETVSICFRDPDEAQKFADFAKACAEEMVALGKDYDHVHFAGGENPDIILARLLPENDK